MSLSSSGIDVSPTVEQRLDQHRMFWNRIQPGAPPVSFRIGDFFFSRHFQAAQPLLGRDLEIVPERLMPRDFTDDYERMYRESLSIGQTGFWTAEPFTGIPWMEGILGCTVTAGSESFTSRPRYSNLEEAVAGTEKVLAGISGTESRFWLSDKCGAVNSWLALYVEFLDTLTRLSQGRFPIGQPILRGITDMFGALIGQERMVYALNDQPEASRRLISLLTDIFLEVQRIQEESLEPFQGGSTLGFYHIWAPGPSLWFQDDLSALLSPSLYREFVIPSLSRFCAACDYNAMHLHSSSFFLLEEILRLDKLQAVEVNIDIGSMSLAEMIPILKRIQQTRCLILWGDLDECDIELIRRSLSSSGLFLNIVTEDIRDARERNRLISTGLWD